MECPFCQSQTGPESKHCEVCGEAIPPGQYLLEESGVVEPAEPEIPEPSSSRPRAARVRNPGSFRFARLGDRFIAFVLDTSVLFGVFAVLDSWIFMRWGRVDGRELQLTTAALLMSLSLNAAVLFLYGWLSEAACGATLGKAMVGIRVVGTAQRGPLAACAVRNVLRIVDGLGFYLVGTAVAACSGIRQRLGDIYAQTAVVEESFGRGTRVAAVVLWVAVLGGSGWSLPRICSSNPAIQSRYLNQVLVRVGQSGRSAYFRVGGFSVSVELALR
jgi:uncharacterized RDD family membrane protein YckC